MKKYFRSIQTLFPFLHDLRFYIEFLYLRLTRKPHEEDFEALKLLQAPSDKVFVDIGTNRGESILSMSLMNQSKNPVIGFEPNPFVYKKAIRAFKERKHVHIHNVGLANKPGNLDLNIPFYRNWMFDGLSSFDYDAAHDWLKNRLWGYKESLLTMKKINCPIHRLDDFNLSPYFIKIDVQGLELQVLKGAEETIRAHRPIILIESISDEIRAYLSGFGYDFYSFQRGGFRRGTGKLNTFCMTTGMFNTIEKAA